MPKLTDMIRDFLDPVDDEADASEKLVLPIDESNRLLRPMGSVRKVVHSFKNGRTPAQKAEQAGFETVVLPLDDEARALMELAKAVRDKAYAKYSGFTVGAALMSASGQVYLGVNIENASYPAGICAERSAISAAISAGERDFTAIAICGRDDSEPCFPCGICRQVLSEFCDEHFQVILADGIYPLGSLLPYAFSF